MTITDTDRKNQRICDLLVQREVIHCCSNMVSEVARMDTDHEISEAIQEISSQPDYETPVRDHESFDRAEDDGEIYLKDEEDPFDSWEEAAAHLRLDPWRYEAYEHWIVSEFLGRKLAEQGEMVGELFGFTIWGRCTTGQGIAMDGVIEAIASSMGILCGQLNEWTLD